MNNSKCTKIALLVVVLCLALAVECGAIDFYFWQMSDTHYIGGMISNGARACVQACNAFAGMSWPYGTMGTPTFVIMCGDLCDGGAWGTTYASDTPVWYTNRNYTHQFNGVDYNFSMNGITYNNNCLKYPTKAVGGNHDYWRWCGYTLGTSTYVANKINERYGGGVTSEGNNKYSFTTNGIHFCAIGRYPDATVRTWLASDLAAVGTSTPVIIFLHYDCDDTDNEWWSDAQRTAFYNVISSYRVIAILNGHSHNTRHYTWRGFDCYDDGSATYFGVINMFHITDTTLQCASYTADCAGGDRDSTDQAGYWPGTGGWNWTYSKTY